MTAVIVSAALAALLSFCGFLLKRSGRTEERLEHEKVLRESTEEALAIEDRLLRDDSFAKRVRKRFTR